MKPALWTGAVAVEDRRLLLVRGGAGSGPGGWSVPTVEVAADEPLAAAVVRAVDEGAGLQAVSEGLLGYLEDLAADHHRVVLLFAVSLLLGGALAPAATWVVCDDVAELPLPPGLVELLVERGILRLIT